MSKVLVAYFTASSGKITETLAKKLAKVAGADLYKIEPKTPYTEKDLDWMDENSRSTLEMKDKSSRPEITGAVDNIDKYETIFIGFPIWWYIAPTIINTFLEQYNLDGKTIVPFATSGSSGMGDTNKYLLPSVKGAILKDGKRFEGSVKEEELKTWATQFI